MNPLPNRPLINNTSLPLALPNIPSLEQIAYNGRPRKVMPEAGKDFPLLNGIGSMSGPSSTPSGTQVSNLERSNPLNSAMVQQLQQHQSGQPGQQIHQQQQNPGPLPLSQMQGQQTDKDKDGEESRQLTAIFRPDDEGEWKEKLRQSHEASEQARLERQSGMLASASTSWDRRRDDDDEAKDEETEVEDDESGVVGESDGNKVWKAKRTLRKSVTSILASAVHSD
jgi:striatin 1/3/4